MPLKSPWRRLSSRTVYQNTWFTLREDAVIDSLGKRELYSFVDYLGSVGIIAVARQGVILVHEWNYPTRRWIWGLPSGGRHRGVSPLNDARRELLEETGLKASKWHRLAVLQESPGLTNDVKYIFLAQNLTGKIVPQKAEAIRAVKFFSWRQVLTMIKRGQVVTAGAVAGLLLAERHL